ncbi:ATP-grasp domain-containing protein [Lysinibacillus xylanilyticus]|uniref:ATP-grasp domain-containing protein n=1 Tax=Lysinibacillus xylanilyticus TaxID=582475 RepID=UPI003CFE878F
MNGAILILSSSNKIPLIEVLRETLPQMKLIGGDVSSEVLSQYFVDEFWKMSNLQNLEYKDFVSYCKQQNIRYVIPTREGELEHFARWRPLLNQEGIQIMISPLEGILYTSDKILFAQKLIANGYPAIPTSHTSSGLHTECFVIKERFGAGSKNLYIKVMPKDVETFSKKLIDPIYQPYIEGTEYSVDVYVMQNGRAKGAVVRERIFVVNGESQITEIAKKPRLEILAMQIAETLNLSGHVMFQIIEDLEGNPHIIECNARFGGASTLSVKAGLDSFNWFIKEADGETLENLTFDPVQRPLKQIRYAKDLIL